jgi:hypothetical protein
MTLYRPSIARPPFQPQPLRRPTPDLLSNRIYSTTFGTAESPMSEGGLWIQGRTNGVEWANVNVSGGAAFGTQNGTNTNSGIGVTPSQYDDSTALLRGSFGPDQAAQATIFGVGHYGTSATEVELRLRSLIFAHFNSGIEVELSLNLDNYYFDFVPWNGQVADFGIGSSQTSVLHLDSVALTAAIGTVADGGIFSASVVGNTVSAYYNGLLIASSTNAAWGAFSGNPGVGFYYHERDTVVSTSSYGFTDFLAQPVLSIGDPENYGQPDGLRGHTQFQQLLAV